jgi:hypothetical protein
MYQQGAEEQPLKQGRGSNRPRITPRRRRKDEKKQLYKERSGQEQLNENKKRNGTNLMKKGRDHRTGRG